LRIFRARMIPWIVKDVKLGSLERRDRENSFGAHMDNMEEWN